MTQRPFPADFRFGVATHDSGQAGIDLEFRKRFDQARFEPDGQQVTEKLVDERIFVE